MGDYLSERNSDDASRQAVEVYAEHLAFAKRISARTLSERVFAGLERGSPRTSELRSDLGLGQVGPPGDVDTKRNIKPGHSFHRLDDELLGHVRLLVRNLEDELVMYL